MITFITMLSLTSKAQIYFRNKTNEPVFVAFCMYNDNKDAKYWYTQGWWKVDPGERIEVSTAMGFNDNIYYYAYSTVSNKKYEGDNNLLVHPTDKFFIKNADKEYNLKENPTFVWRKFRHVEMHGLLKLKYTIELNY